MRTHLDLKIGVPFGGAIFKREGEKPHLTTLDFVVVPPVVRKRKGAKGASGMVLEFTMKA